MARGSHGLVVIQPGDFIQGGNEQRCRISQQGAQSKPPSGHGGNIAGVKVGFSTWAERMKGDQARSTVLQSSGRHLLRVVVFFYPASFA